MKKYLSMLAVVSAVSTISFSSVAAVDTERILCTAQGKNIYSGANAFLEYVPFTHIGQGGTIAEGYEYHTRNFYDSRNEYDGIVSNDYSPGMYAISDKQKSKDSFKILRVHVYPSISTIKHAQNKRGECRSGLPPCLYNQVVRLLNDQTTIFTFDQIRKNVATKKIEYAYIANRHLYRGQLQLKCEFK